MLRQLIGMILLSILVVFTLKYYAMFLSMLHQVYDWLLAKMNLYIPLKASLHIILSISALILIPLSVTYIPAGIYWLLTKRQLPYAKLVFWYVWLMLATVLALHH